MESNILTLCRRRFCFIKSNLEGMLQTSYTSHSDLNMWLPGKKFWADNWSAACCKLPWGSINS